MLSSYARLIVRHSYLFLFSITVVSTVLTVIPLVCHELPSFADPIVGFETRGTTLAQRFMSWENLLDETRPSRSLAVDPKEIADQIRMNHTYTNKTRDDKIRSGHSRKTKGKKRKKKVNYNSTGIQRIWDLDVLDLNASDGHVHWGYGKNVTYEDENLVILRDHTRKQWGKLKAMQREPDKFILNYASGVCGPPESNYARIVLTSNTNKSMLNFEIVQQMCKLQFFLVDISKKEYYNLCQRITHSEDICCPMWSVPNYVSLISGKSNCADLSEEDVNNTIGILKMCAPYFYNFTLMASCYLDRCKVPKYCSQHDAVYNLLYYLIDTDSFLPQTYSQTFVKTSMIFLPLPKSSIVLPYYKELQKSNMSYDEILIPAVDFGLKNTLFDLWIIQDTWLVGLGGIFVFFCVWLYTKSFLLSVLLFIAIFYSIGIAYFLYVYIFNLVFFPFMNLLVIVVVIGIGADDAFLYVKVWKMVGNQLIQDNVASQNNGLSVINNVSSAGETILVQILEETLKHSVVAILVTTLTTAVAFFASYVSYIPAINCFSVFAGTAVLVNFILMVSWLPVSVFILDVKLYRFKIHVLETLHKSIIEIGEDIRVVLKRFIITCVTKLNIIFLIVMGAIGIGSIIVVFYSPGLQLPDSNQFQLFQTFHPFEQYDMKYKDKFLFERFGSYAGTGGNMPLRWIWGVKALDNGNNMNPYSRGHLVLDEEFSISDPNSQIWLLNFCSKLKSQSFYLPTIGPLLPNCFIESFKMYMSRRCIDKIDRINRSPCCESSKFPYKKEVFEFCIIKAMESLYQTPRELFIPGVAGPKFLRSANPPKIVAIVVEFESVVPYSMNYTAMNNFFIHVENWTVEELKTAPPSMKGGWFISDLQFYDLQKTLASGTVMALLLSAGLGFVVLVPATLNLVVSICALMAMIFSSTVTIAILVLHDWKLNILESVAISTSAGLAVDFSLHYALSYTNACGNKCSRVKYALTASAGPTACAALTTGFAGIFLLRSHLIPYSQIGIFLALITSISWVYATFFLCSLLNIFGRNSFKENAGDETKSLSRVSSICSGIPNLESHELEHLADSNRTNVTHSQSPSSISATTVVLHDEFNNSEIKVGKIVFNNVSEIECNND